MHEQPPSHEQLKIPKFAVSYFEFPEVENHECMIILLKGKFTEVEFASWVLEASRRAMRQSIDAECECTVLKRDEIPEFLYERVREARILTEEEYEDLFDTIRQQFEDSQF